MTTEVAEKVVRVSHLPDRLLGATGVGMMLLAVWLLLFGGPGDQTTSLATLPTLAMTSPVQGDTISSTLEIHFTSSSPVQATRDGWGSSGYHVHATINGIEVMPGPGQIGREGEGYRWTIPDVPSGDLEVSLFWSDANHRRIPDSGPPAVTVVVQ